MSYGLTIRRLAFIISFIVLFAGGGCEKQDRRGDQEVDQPNILMIMVDALRADHLKMYGHFVQTAPFLTQWAEEGFVFEQAYAQATMTRTSVPSMLASRYVSSFLVSSRSTVTIGKKKLSTRDILSSHAVTLAEVLEKHNYQTGAFSANPYVDRIFGLGQGFQEFRMIRGLRGTGSSLNNSFFDWVSKIDTDRPFFAYLHYIEVHGPYGAPQHYCDEFLKHYRTLPSRTLSEKEFRELPRINMQTRELNDYLAVYDAQILYWDNLFMRIWNAVVADELGKNLLIVFTSDHGEAFFEHGKSRHGNTLHRELLHVPLIFHMPGRISPGRSATPVALIDLAPTILDLVGIQPPRQFQGRSLVPELFRKAIPSLPVVSELTVRTIGHQATVLKGNYRWIYNEAFDLITDVYNVEIDPGEQNNLVRETDSETLEEMAAWFRSWLDQQRKNRLPPPKIEPNRTLDEEKIKHLKYLGYVQ